MRRTRLMCGAMAGLAGAVCLSVVMQAQAPGRTTVADAAQRGDRATVKMLLKEAADVNAAQGDGMTALHWAALNGDAELAQMLLYAGANVKAVTRLGNYTPLFLAAREGKPAADPRSGQGWRRREADDRDRHDGADGRSAVGQRRPPCGRCSTPEWTSTPWNRFAG